MKLVIVESPNKRKSIQEILKKVFPQEFWRVEASCGHICQLANGGDDNTGITITQQGVTIHYQPNQKRGKETIERLAGLAKQASSIVLATDGDREGEAISWHLAREVCGKTPYERVVYHEITEAGLRKAFHDSRSLDRGLVDSQRTRQALDRLIGYKVSPVLIRLKQGRSAGRVQSAALHLIAELERSISNFQPTPYWSLTTTYTEGLSAAYVGVKAPISKSADHQIDRVNRVGDLHEDLRSQVDDAQDVQEKEEVSARVLSKSDADKIIAIARQNPHRVVENDGRDIKQSPPPPLTTSTLQQVASVKLGFSSEKTMQIAQSLFEGVDLPDGKHHGIITYHRTDSIALAEEFCYSVRAWLKAHNRDTLIPSQIPSYREKRGSQGAHEAIRPTQVEYTPGDLAAYLSVEQHALYQIIWNRAVASQCKPAIFRKTRIVIQAGQTYWVAQGSILLSAGYTHFWRNIGDNAELPAVKSAQELTVSRIESAEKATTPPKRFTEARLIQQLDRLGIGRPSTYASIMQTLKERQYVETKGKTLKPTELGLQTDNALQEYFPDLIQTNFTAHMEASLDSIAIEELQWEQYLMGFYFNYLLPALQRAGEVVLKSYKRSDIACPKCQHLMVKVPSKFQRQNPQDPDYYLRCVQPDCETILVWNTHGNWVPWAKQVERTVQVPLQMTEFCCQVCGEPLAEYAYNKDGENKRRLQCSGNATRQDHQKEIYWFSSRDKYWNPFLKREASREFSQPQKTKPQKVLARAKSK